MGRGDGGCGNRPVGKREKYRLVFFPLGTIIVYFDSLTRWPRWNGRFTSWPICGEIDVERKFKSMSSTHKRIFKKSNTYLDLVEFRVLLGMSVEFQWAPVDIVLVEGFQALDGYHLAVEWGLHRLGNVDRLEIHRNAILRDHIENHFQRTINCRNLNTAYRV